MSNSMPFWFNITTLQKRTESSPYKNVYSIKLWPWSTSLRLCVHWFVEFYIPEACSNWKTPCDDGVCLPFWLFCDKTEDCSDGSDEKDCPRKCSLFVLQSGWGFIHPLVGACHWVVMHQWILEKRWKLWDCHLPSSFGIDLRQWLPRPQVVMGAHSWRCRHHLVSFNHCSSQSFDTGYVRLASPGRPWCVAFSFSRTNVCR